MKVAIMQPYFMPYIGYFQLINAVDKFVIYDDVNFIKRGWVNRNQLLINSGAKLFSVPIEKLSQNKLIMESKLSNYSKWSKRFYSTIEYNYKKSPHFDSAYVLIKKVMDIEYSSISELNIASIKIISKYLNISTSFELSSEKYSQTKGLEKSDRLIEISKLNKADSYINPLGGLDIYNKNYFKKYGVELFFIRNNIVPYPQFQAGFVGGLSIIDTLMFNSKEEVKKMLNEYTLA